MMRALGTAVATTALGASALFAGVATQPPVPAAPIVLAAADDSLDLEDQLAESVADMTRDEDPSDWDSRYGDGSHD